MIEILKFVRAAVDEKGHLEYMGFFRIKNGTIQANTGKLAIQAPFPSDIDCCPHAGQFFKAISACEDVISMHLEAGKLIVKSGKFKTHVDCMDTANFREFVPAGPMYPIKAPIVPTLKKLFPFVSTDEKRPWACGVYLANNSAIVTNSICILEHWMPFAFPVIANVPRNAVSELIRLHIEPTGIQANERAVIFHLPGDAWIACGLLNYKWPDIQTVFFNAAKYKGKYVNAGNLETLLDAVAKLDGFTDELEAVYFHKGSISTTPEGQPGTVIECPFSPGVGVFRSDQLKALRGIVDKIGFEAYPAPVPFYGGDLLRGVMVGFKS